MIKKQIKKEIDACIGAELEGTMHHIKQCYNLLLPHIETDYNNSRDTIQFCINQLQRISPYSGLIQKEIAMDNLRAITPSFLNKPSPSLDYFNIKWDDAEIQSFFGKMAPFLSGELFTSTLYPQIAEILTTDERRKMTSYIINSVQHYGLKTTWNKTIIENQIVLCIILYSICKKDDVMDLLFTFYYNVLDRLNYSGEHQLARDYAENLLIIGYNENLLAESYFGACRAYTLANNPIAGLLYMNISLTNLRQRENAIPKRLVFEILWQMLKIMRGLKLSSETDITFISKEFEKLGCTDYEKLSFYHSVYTVSFYSQEKKLPNKIIDFLNENQEIFFKNIEHSAMPWFSLFKTLHSLFPNANYSGLEFYENAVQQTLKEEGNELYLDLCANKNLASHLKEQLVKLQSTRERDDYSRDNQIALTLATRLLSQAVKEDNPENYILAMQPKTDFTFVLPANTQTQMYRQVTVENVNGNDYSIFYQKIESLKLLLRADDSDAVMWIGKGSDNMYSMILLRDMYTFKTLEGWNDTNVTQIQRDLISPLQYAKEINKEGEPIYTKSNDELEQEGESLLVSLKKSSLPIPVVAARMFFIKDLEIAAYPHQLIIDNRTNQFVGEKIPTANVISTELFIKTNFDSPLQRDYSKSFWIPTDSGEFTFSVILGQLENLIQKYKIDVHCELVPSIPLHADLNIVCAHGGKNISETEWFYANEQPLIETEKIVNQGKLLILFVCHSGTITRTNYDNAMHTIVKRYIQMGYSSVIAPMWSLPTTIISTWLTTFLEHMETGDYVVDAVYKANMQVRDVFIAPSAWACLHVFGNPYLQISDEARLTLMDEQQ